MAIMSSNVMGRLPEGFCAAAKEVVARKARNAITKEEMRLCMCFPVRGRGWTLAARRASVHRSRAPGDAAIAEERRSSPGKKNWGRDTLSRPLLCGSGVALGGGISGAVAGLCEPLAQLFAHQGQAEHVALKLL